MNYRFEVVHEPKTIENDASWHVGIFNDDTGEAITHEYFTSRKEAARYVKEMREFLTD